MKNIKSRELWRRTNESSFVTTAEEDFYKLQDLELSIENVIDQLSDISSKFNSGGESKQSTISDCITQLKNLVTDIHDEIEKYDNYEER